MEETKVQDTNTKTQLSLAAALFFSPLVQYMLKTNNRDITEKDKIFIRGYIKFGYLTLLFWGIVIAAGSMKYLFPWELLRIVYIVSIFLLLLLLVIGVVGILADISLLKWGNTKENHTTIEGNKKDIILTYLPLYNIYLWYKTHTFNKPNWRIKESILAWILFGIACLLGNIFVASSILILIILRIAALMSDIDILNITFKQKLNTLFTKNPEELRWYITGFICFFAKSLYNIVTKIQYFTLEQEVAQEKERYSRIISMQGNISLILEYILWILLTIGLVYLTNLDFTVRTYYAWWLLLVGRYLIMAIQLKHLPHLPIARELVLLGTTLGSIFRKKSFTPNK